MTLKPTLSQFGTKILLALAVALHGSVSIAQENPFYVVQKGDQLIRVLRQCGLTPVRGKDGSLDNILELNPSKQSRRGDFILPGEKIIFPSADRARVAKVSFIAKDGRVFPGRPPAALGSPRRMTAAEEPSARPEKSLAPPEPIAPAAAPFQASSGLVLSPSFNSTTLRSTDSSTKDTATLASQIHVGVEVLYFQQWTPRVQSYLGFKLGYVGFEPPTNNARTLDERYKWTTAISLGGKYKFSADSGLALTLAGRKELFVRATSATSVTVDTVMLPSLAAQYSYDFFHRAPWILGASVLGELNFSGSTETYKIDSGTSEGLAIYLIDGPRGRYRTELGYFYRSQNTSISLQNETDLRITLGIGY